MYTWNFFTLLDVCLVANLQFCIEMLGLVSLDDRTKFGDTYNCRSYEIDHSLHRLRNAILLTRNVRLASLLMLVNVVLGVEKAFGLVDSRIEVQPAQTLALSYSVVRYASRREPSFDCFYVVRTAFN